MHAYRTKTRVSRSLKGLVRADIGLFVASTVTLVVGLVLTSSGVHTIESDSTELRTEPEIKFDSADAHGATFDDRFNQQAASFSERFASAFGSSGNAGHVAAVEEHGEPATGEPATGEPATDKPVVTPVALPPATSRHASVHEERLGIAVASLRLNVPVGSDSHTAIYDISARTVYLPNGTRLEAHSGLGSRLDDPRYIKAKAVGATPPNVYNLALRERLFHGVRAIRLVPVDDGKMFGRDGILAHTYMLGPSGQSNGCVSFRNYPAFLNAFLTGEIHRLVVVDHLATAIGAKAGPASAVFDAASGG